jgi:hypothetical protein
MKKLFTLFGALLLWQTMAVAQNYLHIMQEDSTQMEVSISELDSVTVREDKFYEPKYLCEGIFQEQFFYEDSPFNVSIYTRENTFIVKEALVGKDFTFIYDPNSGDCIANIQVTGYEHPTYGIVRVQGNGYKNEDDNCFYFNLQYTVDAGSFGTYPAILQLQDSTAAPARVRKQMMAEPEINSIELVSFAAAKRAKQVPAMVKMKFDEPKPTSTASKGTASAMQLKMVPKNDIVNK